MAGDSTDDSLSLDALKRGDALAVLRDGPMSRATLMAQLDVSRTTIHRVVRGLEARALLVQRGNDLELTPFGALVADEVSTYRRRIDAVRRGLPFLETVVDAPVDVDVELFEDARVTEMEPTNPYGPVTRFVELLRSSSTLRGFDTTTVAPIYVEEIRDEILGGMETDIVYLPAVVSDIVEAYPEDVTAAIESGRLTLSTHEALPFGLAIFDDRVGLGGYDDDTGMLRAFVDTDAPNAREWALDLYEQFRGESTPLDVLSCVGD